MRYSVALFSASPRIRYLKEDVLNLFMKTSRRVSQAPLRIHSIVHHARIS